MLKFRTTKEVQTSLHTEETNIIEFRYRYNRTFDGMKIMCDAYKIANDDIAELIPGGGSYRDITYENLQTLIIGAMQITPTNDNPLVYMDDLVKSGIKIVIVTESLWKNKLTINDFE